MTVGIGGSPICRSARRVTRSPCSFHSSTMKGDSIFSGLRANIFPQGELGEFWQGVSKALVWFILIIGLWLGYSGARIAISFTWEEKEVVWFSGPSNLRDPITESYSYEVDGSKYSSSRFYFGGNSLSNRMPVDRKIFFNPKKPAQSVVYRRYSTTHFSFFLLAVGAVFARRFIYRNYAR